MATFSNMSSSPSGTEQLTEVKKCGRVTTLCLAAAHALVLLDDGTIVGDPMEKVTLESLGWKLAEGNSLMLLKIFSSTSYCNGFRGGYLSRKPSRA
jgi:hypothetical protein